jgi:hypothetical protein
MERRVTRSIEGAAKARGSPSLLFNAASVAPSQILNYREIKNLVGFEGKKTVRKSQPQVAGEKPSPAGKLTCPDHRPVELSLAQAAEPALSAIDGQKSETRERFNGDDERDTHGLTAGAKRNSRIQHDSSVVAQVRAALEPLSFMVVDPLGDGNCIFWALLFVVSILGVACSRLAKEFIRIFRDMPSSASLSVRMAMARFKFAERLQEEYELGDAPDLAAVNNWRSGIAGLRKGGYHGDAQGNMVDLLKHATGISIVGQDILFESPQTEPLMGNKRGFVVIVGQHAYAVIKRELFNLQAWQVSLGADVASTYVILDSERLAPGQREAPAVEVLSQGPNSQTNDSDALALLKAKDPTLSTCICGFDFGAPLSITGARHVRDKHGSLSMTTLLEACKVANTAMLCPDCQGLYATYENGTIRSHKSCPVRTSTTPLQSAAAQSAPQGSASGASQADAVTSVGVVPVVGEQEHFVHSGAEYQRKFREILRELMRVHDDDALDGDAKLQAFRGGVRRMIALERPAEESADEVHIVRPPEEQAVAYLQHGENSKAIQALEGTGLAHPTADQIKAKFPLADPQESAQAPQRLARMEAFTGKEVKEYSKSRYSLAAIGPDGCPAQFISKVAEDPETGSDLARLYTYMVKHNVLTADDLLRFTRVKLTTLEKPNGDFRPIGVGTGFARFFLGLVARRLNAVVAPALHRDNFTLQSSGISIEALVAWRNYELGGTAVCDDRANAFNSMSVERAIVAMRKEGLESAAVLASFNLQHEVVFKGGSFRTANIPQGAAAGTTMAAVIVDDCIKGAREQYSTAVIGSYSDDVNCMDALEARALAASAKANQGFDAMGLAANPAKRQIINKVNNNTGKIGGAHIGKEASGATMGTWREIADLGSRLASLVEPLGMTKTPMKQSALRALRNNICQKANHLSRVQPVEQCLEGAKLLDAAVLESFQRIVGFSASEIAQMKAQFYMAVRDGGIGFPKYEEMVHFLRLGELASTFVEVAERIDRMHPDLAAQPLYPELSELVDTCRAIAGVAVDDDLWKDLEYLKDVNDRKQIPDSPQVRMLQGLGKRLRKRHDALRAKRRKDSFDKTNLTVQEKLASATSKESLRFVNVVLRKVRPNHMFDEEFVNALRERCLLRAVPLGTGPCMVCTGCIDDFGEHFFTCKHLGQGAAHLPTQNAAVMAIREIGKDLDLEVTPTPSLVDYMDPAANVPRPGKHVQKAERPQADIRVRDLKNRTTVYIDVRTCAMTHPKTLEDVGKTTELGEKAKVDQYADLYIFPEGVRMIPFAIDTHGRWGKAFEDYVKSLCLMKSAGIKNDVYAMALSRIKDKICVAHARAVGRRMIYGRKRCVEPRSDPRLATRAF